MMLQFHAVVYIMQFAFAGTNLSSIILPDNVFMISEKAFEDTNLTTIILPASIGEIHESAFYCTNLTSVTFESNTISIGQHLAEAFYGDLRVKYQSGGAGTYTTTAPVDSSSVWTKQ